MRDSLILHEQNNPSPPAAPYPLPSERAVINCGPAVNPNVGTRGGGNAPRTPLKTQREKEKESRESYFPQTPTTEVDVPNAGIVPVAV